MLFKGTRTYDYPHIRLASRLLYNHRTTPESGDYIEHIRQFSSVNSSGSQKQPKKRRFWMDELFGVSKTSVGKRK